MRYRRIAVSDLSYWVPEVQSCPLRCNAQAACSVHREFATFLAYVDCLPAVSESHAGDGLETMQTRVAFDHTKGPHCSKCLYLPRNPEHHWPLALMGQLVRAKTVLVSLRPAPPLVGRFITSSQLLQPNQPQPAQLVGTARDRAWHPPVLSRAELCRGISSTKARTETRSLNLFHLGGYAAHFENFL